MLTDVFPRASARFLRLPVLGPVVDGFAQSLVQQGYRRSSLRMSIRTLPRIASQLQAGGCCCLDELKRSDLRACAPVDAQADRMLAATVHALERFLDREGMLDVLIREPQTPTATLRQAYEVFLGEVRGLADTTLARHLNTARAFLEQRSEGCESDRPPTPSADAIEELMRRRGREVGRGTLQHVAAELRGFLRFLASTGRAPAELDGAVETPRLDRDERLSRALPWRMVQACLQAIERNTPLGLRDHAMFSLFATYGLRASEVVALTLDDIDWRAGRLHIAQRKTAGELLLPLSDAVGDSLIAYLRDGRPTLPVRQVFLRMRAPTGVLRATAISDAFERWRLRSGLAIAPQGPHCLRHADAVHLLRCGTPLKTIGDLLGHRSAESTCGYLRLAVEDLREVPLELPQEVRS